MDKTHVWPFAAGFNARCKARTVAANAIVVGEYPIVSEPMPELHDAHVAAEFSHWLENLPMATWASDAPKLPAPPKAKVKAAPKGSPLLLALIKRVEPRRWPFVPDFDYAFDLESFVDF